MRIDQTRPDVLAVTATRAELALLAAAARVALDVIRVDPGTSSASLGALERVLGDYDAAIGRMTEGVTTCTSS
jgi:hypothetical protein